MIAACNGRPAATGNAPVVIVGGEVLDVSVVEMIEQRDSVDAEQARQRATDTLRLVAASRERRAARPGEPTTELPSDRIAHLTRAARSRLWLDTEFEHRTAIERIPEREMLRSLRRVVHPELHLVCQVIVMPTPEGTAAPTGFDDNPDDPAWRARARERLGPIRQQIDHSIVLGEDQTCHNIAQFVGLLPLEADGLRIKYEDGGFALDACVEEDADGECVRKLYVDEWTERVQGQPPGRLVEPFFSRFGLHLVYLQEIKPETKREDEGVDDELRALAHPRWQAQQFIDYLGTLRNERTVRIAAGIREPR